MRLVLLLLALGTLQAVDPAPLVERVVVVVVDGPRWSETWGEPTRTHIPRRAQELAPRGVLFTNFRNAGWTYTNAGHAALTTGVHQPLDNSGRELPGHESWLQRWRALTGQPAEAAWVVTSKDKLAVLTDTTDVTWAGKLRPAGDCGIDGKGLGSGYRSDQATMDAVGRIVTAHAPSLLFINLLGPDANGHARKWEGYLAAIRETDALLAELWTRLEANAVYRGKTALFITNDHGRHLDGVRDGFVSHDDECPGCRHIELLAIVPGIPGGQVIAEEYNQTDLAATISRLLGVGLPAATARLIPPLIPTP
jgi:hypothetical protein